MTTKKTTWTERFETLDRRYIFIFVALAILAPFLFPLNLPVTVTKPVQDFYDVLKNLPDGARILLSADWDAGSRAEIYPINVAVLEQLFQKNVKLICMSLWAPGPRMLDQCIEEVAPKYNKKYGIDYVNLGFKEGREVVMIALGESIAQTFPTDTNQTPVQEIPVLRDIKNYDDIDLIITLSAGYPGTKEWVQQVQNRFKKPMLSGCGGVSSPEYYPYYEAGQLTGLIGGLKACAEYELLLDRRAKATKAMDAQALGHYIIVLFIVLGNILFVINKLKSRRTA